MRGGKKEHGHVGEFTYSMMKVVHYDGRYRGSVVRVYVATIPRHWGASRSRVCVALSVAM